MKFRAVVVQSGKTMTGIPIPAEVLAALGAGRKPPVAQRRIGESPAMLREGRRP